MKTTHIFLALLLLSTSSLVSVDALANPGGKDGFRATKNDRTEGKTEISGSKGGLSDDEEMADTKKSGTLSKKSGFRATHKDKSEGKAEIAGSKGGYKDDDDKQKPEASLDDGL